MECLLFDFGGTLDSDGLSWLDRFHVIYKEAGVQLTDRAFYDADDQLPQKHKLTGLSLGETVLLQVKDVLSVIAPKQVDTLAPVIADKFVADCKAHLRRNKFILERLAQRYKLGIVSNWYGNMSSILAGEGLSELFGAVADSGVIGTIKPEPGIFMAALDQLGARPSQAVMIGDNVKRDMRGAENLMMRHVQLSPSGGACCPKGVMIKSLTELENALSGVPA